MVKVQNMKGSKHMRTENIQFSITPDQAETIIEHFYPYKTKEFRDNLQNYEISELLDNLIDESC